MIGYYVHHHGVGHLTRAMSIAARLGEPVVVLSSSPEPADHPFQHWISLPLDTDSSAPVDPSAHEVLHWAPIGVTGLRDRMATITAWIASARPRVVVVDVSVEVTVLVRLLGTPVVVMAIPGERTDLPHDLAYRVADHILAPWSRQVYDPSWLRTYGRKVSYVGSISRFDGRRRVALPITERPMVLVLGGAGGSAVDTATVAECASANPTVDWVSAGVGGTWVDDVWPLLCTADVVVTHAGQNAIADTAAAGARAVVIPQSRPFSEQLATAHALHDNDIAVTVQQWPASSQWSDVLCDARRIDLSRWALLEVSGAADRAAAVLRSSP